MVWCLDGFGITHIHCSLVEFLVHTHYSLFSSLSPFILHPFCLLFILCSLYLFFILYSLFFILYSLFFILYSFFYFLFVVIYSLMAFIHFSYSTHWEESLDVAVLVVLQRKETREKKRYSIPQHKEIYTIGYYL